MALRFKAVVLGAVAAAILTMSGPSMLAAQDMPAKIDDKAKAAVVAKERLDYMLGMGANEKILVAVMRGQEPLDAKAVAAAEKLAAFDPKELLSHFNPGTGDDVVGTTRARALIWTEWDNFKGLAATVQPAVAAALAAAKSGDAKAFAEKEQAAVSACNACHKVYRAPRKQ